ncbi:hypothetical protein BLNAU_18373 [Blattamonas nauphoetae]|uniref:Uncharacterized protein n=1 Tax=Blattamonas nauphoetae TaxID=2049346 RepID=A0ABQ9X4J8_9EUKA|nr:hypothetical protein BLNAU_18373 [Blattamonas nauphoetae]
MPPKHLIWRKSVDSQATPHVQTDQFCISNPAIVDSSRPDNITSNEDSSINSCATQFTNDFLTILPDDRRYIQFSKQIMEYETKRRRIHLEPKSVRSHLEDSEIPLQSSITSDWRVVSQDSITGYYLEKGCISLFKQVDSGTELSPSDVDHAIRFLNYITMFFKNDSQSPYSFFKYFFSSDFPLTTFTSSLIKLISHPSNTLRTAAIAFFSIGFSNWKPEYFHKITETDFFFQLLSLLKPHEIPFGDATMEFHNHVTSIVLHFIDESDSFSENPLPSETVSSILRAFCPYLRHLITHPVFFPWKQYRMIDSILKILGKKTKIASTRSTHPELVEFVDNMRDTMSEEFALSIGLANRAKKAKYLLFGRQDSKRTSDWMKGFEYLLAHAEEGNHSSDLGIRVFHFAGDIRK